MRKRFNKEYLTITLFIALILRLFVVFITNNTPLIYDEVEYYQISDQIVKGNGYSNVEGPTAFRPPAYPVFLAGIRMISGNDPHHQLIAVRIVQAFLGSILALITYLVCREILNKRISRLAALFVALNPSLIAYAAALMTENIFLPLFCTAVLFTLRALGRKNRAYPYLAGITFGLAILSRPSAIAFIPVLFLWVYGRREWRKSLHKLAIIAIIAALCITPWIIRNNLISDGLILMDTRTGYNLYMGYNENATGRYDHRTAELLFRLPDEFERNRWGLARAKSFIREHPLQSALLIPRKFMYFWELDRREFISKLSYNAIGPLYPSQIQFFFLLVMGSFTFLVIYSIIGTSFSDKKSLWPLLTIILSFTLLHSVTLADSRMHLVLVPFLAILASAGIYSIDCIRKSRISKDPAQRKRTMKTVLICSAIITLFVGMWIYGLIQDISLFKMLLSEGGHMARIPY